MSERTSEWPSTYVSILVSSRPQCYGSKQRDVETIKWSLFHEVENEWPSEWTSEPASGQKSGLVLTLRLRVVLNHSAWVKLLSKPFIFNRYIHRTNAIQKQKGKPNFPNWHPNKSTISICFLVKTRFRPATNDTWDLKTAKNRTVLALTAWDQSVRPNRTNAIGCNGVSVLLVMSWHSQPRISPLGPIALMPSAAMG